MAISSNHQACEEQGPGFSKQYPYSLDIWKGLNESDNVQNQMILNTGQVIQCQYSTTETGT